MSNFVNLLDIIYPVGSMYFNTSGVSPASTVGGTWEQIKDANIAATGNKFAKGYIGSYKINKKQLPHHAHTIVKNRAVSDLSTLDTYGDTQLEMWTNVNNAETNSDKIQTIASYWINSGQKYNILDGSLAYSSGGKTSWLNLLYAWQMPHGGAGLLPIFLHLLCVETHCLVFLKELVYNG